MLHAHRDAVTRRLDFLQLVRIHDIHGMITQFLKKTYAFSSFADFSEDASPPAERPPLRLVLKTEGSSNYGTEYTSSLPLTPDSTREILSVINRS